MKDCIVIEVAVHTLVAHCHIINIDITWANVRIQANLLAGTVSTVAPSSEKVEAKLCM